ncbi:MAG: co-chaperonin GroES [Methanoregulaceae archaeon PtaU1.Bin222]|nr:MAG: co-chaperonin GroES [Methanoregulaceae archaeon PtaU1.Bin222]
MKEIIPIGERVLIKPLKLEEMTRSGIYIPESAQEHRKEGSVIAVGCRDDGAALPLKPGDHVLYGGYSADKFEMDGENYVFVPFKDILAKIE